MVSFLERVPTKTCFIDYKKYIRHYAVFHSGFSSQLASSNQVRQTVSAVDGDLLKPV
jgi:hypothetical protein